LPSSRGCLRIEREGFPTAIMKILLAAIVAIVIAGSVYADYRWRKWLEARRRERDSSNPSADR